MIFSKISDDSEEAQVLLRLFKLVFGSVVAFPENEVVITPHLHTIVNACVMHAKNKKVRQFC